VSTTPTTPASTPNTGASVMSMPQAGSGRLLNAVTAPERGDSGYGRLTVSVFFSERRLPLASRSVSVRVALSLWPRATIERPAEVR
jgi:hypothetical protein